MQSDTTGDNAQDKMAPEANKPVNELTVIGGIHRWLEKLPPHRRRPLLEYVIGTLPRMVAGPQMLPGSGDHLGV